MYIYVLICTINDGIRRVPSVLLPTQSEVRYIVSWQQTETPGDDVQREVKTLEQREDVTITTLMGRGLSRNRNHAFQTALSLLPDSLADAIMVIADDDVQLEPSAFETLREVYSRYERLDIALLRALNSDTGQPINPFPEKPVLYRNKPRSFYPCSVEMTMRSRVWHSGLRFDERFGLGSEYLCSGEEDIFMVDAMRKGMNALIVPKDLCQTRGETTGSRVLDPLVLRSKGSTYGYSRPLPSAILRAMREAISLGIRNHANPICLFKYIWQGIKYIRS